MKQTLFFTIVMNCNQVTDIFIMLSGFLGAYKCMQIYDANGGKLGTSVVLRLYLRKFLRLAPMLYIIFSVGWFFGARMQESALWMSY